MPAVTAPSACEGPRCAGFAGGHDPRAGRRRGRPTRAVDELTELTELVAATRQIAAQARQRLSV